MKINRNRKLIVVLFDRTKTKISEKSYNCPFCGRPFAFKSNLMRHQRTHTGEKPFECDICKARFLLKKNLHDHRRIHTGEKPFTCGQCGLSVSRRFSLVRHLRNHTSNFAKKFTCHNCDKTFSFKYHLRHHIIRAHLVDGRRRKCKKQMATNTPTITTKPSIGEQQQQQQQQNQSQLLNSTVRDEYSDFDASYAKEKPDEMKKLLELMEIVEKLTVAEILANMRNFQR